MSVRTSTTLAIVINLLAACGGTGPSTATTPNSALSPTVVQLPAPVTSITPLNPPASTLWDGPFGAAGSACDLQMQYGHGDLAEAAKVYTETVLWTYSVNFKQTPPTDLNTRGDVLGCLRVYVRSPVTPANTYINLFSGAFSAGVPVIGCRTSAGYSPSLGITLSTVSFAECNVHLDSLFQQISATLDSTITVANPQLAKAFRDYVGDTNKAHSPYIGLGTVADAVIKAPSQPIVVVWPEYGAKSPVVGQGVVEGGNPFFALGSEVFVGRLSSGNNAGRTLWTSLAPMAFRTDIYPYLPVGPWVFLERYASQDRVPSSVTTFACSANSGVVPCQATGVSAAPFHHGRTSIYFGPHPAVQSASFMSPTGVASASVLLEEVIVDPASSGSDNSSGK